MSDSTTAVNLLVVERNADWSEWASISRHLSAVLMLVQQPDEPSTEFHARILERMAETGLSLEQVVLLRGSFELATEREPLSLPLLEHIGANARLGLRVYPSAALHA